MSYAASLDMVCKVCKGSCQRFYWILCCILYCRIEELKESVTRTQEELVKQRN